MSTQPAPYRYLATLHAVEDAGTMSVQVDLGFGVQVRVLVSLRGFNAPHTGFCPPAEAAHGRAAAAFVRETLGSEEFVLDSHGRAPTGTWEVSIFPPPGDISLCGLLRDHGFERRAAYEGPHRA